VTARDERAAIVVAGGRGVRLGEGPPKALRQLGGRTLLERMVERARTWSNEVIVSAPPAMEIPNVGATVVRDAAAFGPWAGPLVALASALGSVRAPWAVALAVDLPFVRDELIELLWSRRMREATPLSGTPSHAEALAVIPWSSRGAEPLCALYRREAAPILMAASREGERALSRAALALPLVQIPEEEVRALDPNLESFTNVNTPEQWTAAEERLRA
jgi:molybdopterin-guanine dinucleotide biosynthesis protein A